MKKVLENTNKYLKDSKTREKILISHAIASSRIEGITFTPKQVQTVERRVFKKPS